MPSSSAAQHNLMAMVANNPAAAKRLGIPQSVGQEFMKADKGKKFGTGSSNSGRNLAKLQAINKPEVHRGKMALFSKGGDMAESKAMMKKEVSFMKKKGAPPAMLKHEEAEMRGMKPKKMAAGGLSSGHKSADGVARKGKTKGKMVKMAYGGKAC